MSLKYCSGCPLPGCLCSPGHCLNCFCGFCGDKGSSSLADSGSLQASQLSTPFEDGPFENTRGIERCVKMKTPQKKSYENTVSFRFPWKQWNWLLLVELKPLGMLRCQAVWVSYRCWASTTRWTRQWLFWRVEQRKIPMKGCQGCWASTTKNLILSKEWFLMLLCLAFILRHIHKVSWLLIIQLSFWNISLILFLVGS